MKNWFLALQVKKTKMRFVHGNFKHTRPRRAHNTSSSLRLDHHECTIHSNASQDEPMSGMGLEERRVQGFSLGVCKAHWVILQKRPCTQQFNAPVLFMFSTAATTTPSADVINICHSSGLATGRPGLHIGLCMCWWHLRPACHGVL